VFKKPKVLISDAEILSNIEKRLSLGLIEKWEALRILDPNLSEEAAREKADGIMASNMSKIQSLMPKMQPPMQKPPMKQDQLGVLEDGDREDI